jgi:hypothetical protein
VYENNEVTGVSVMSEVVSTERMEVISDEVGNAHLPPEYRRRSIEYACPNSAYEFNIFDKPNGNPWWVVRWPSGLLRDGLAATLRRLAVGDEGASLLVSTIDGKAEWYRGDNTGKFKYETEAYSHPVPLEQALASPFVFARFETDQYAFVWESLTDNEDGVNYDDYVFSFISDGKIGPGQTEALILAQESAREIDRPDAATVLAAADQAWSDYVANRVN